jgi:hypothetical protein
MFTILVYQDRFDYFWCKIRITNKLLTSPWHNYFKCFAGQAKSSKRCGSSDADDQTSQWTRSSFSRSVSVWEMLECLENYFYEFFGGLDSLKLECRPGPRRNFKNVETFLPC